MLLTADARGVFPIAPTPFFDDGRIDTASIDRLTDFYLGIGATGLTVLGQLGEAPKLEHAESVAVARRMIRRAARLPVIVGVSAPGFAAMRALTHEVMAAGAAGVMIAPPNTLRTDDQIVGYYRQAVQAIGADVPFVLQDYPLTFSVQMSPGVIRRIVDELPSCVMLKHEDWPGLEKISTLRGCERDGSHAPHRHPVRQRRPVPRLRDGARRRRRQYRLCLPRHVVRRGAPVAGRPARRGARPVRRPPAVAALRTAARRGPGGAQIRADAPRPAGQRQPAATGGAADGGGTRPRSTTCWSGWRGAMRGPGCRRLDTGPACG